MRVKSNGKKTLLIGAVLALVVALSIGLTSAFLTHKTEGLTNTFTPGSVTCQVKEQVSGTNKTSVQVQNTGTVPAYIRVAVVGNSVDNEGNIIGAADVNKSLAATGWSKAGDYYYFDEVVEPNEFTGELLNAPIDLTGVQVTVLAQAIQAHGVTGKTPAVEDAWGLVPDSN